MLFYIPHYSYFSTYYLRRNNEEIFFYVTWCLITELLVVLETEHSNIVQSLLERGPTTITRDCAEHTSDMLYCLRQLRNARLCMRMFIYFGIITDIYIIIFLSYYGNHGMRVTVFWLLRRAP